MDYFNLIEGKADSYEALKDDFLLYTDKINATTIKIFDIIFAIVLYILILLALLMHLYDLLVYFNSALSKISEPVATKSPYNDSIYYRYCKIENYQPNDEFILNNDYLLHFGIYLILFIIFWSNHIMDLFNSYNDNFVVKNEIKLIVFSKYFNYDLTNKTDYNFLYFIKYYILFMFIIYTLLILNKYTSGKSVDNQIYNSLSTINKTIADNFDCEFYKVLAKDNGKTDINKIKDYVNTKNIEEVYGNPGDDDIINKRMKLLITYILYYHVSFRKIREISAIKSTANMCDLLPPINKCVYKYFTNVKQDEIFPEFNDIENIRYIISPPTFDSETSLSNYYKINNIYAIKKESIELVYKNFYNTIKENSKVITGYRDDYNASYKMEIATATIFGFFIFLLITIFFFYIFKIHFNVKFNPFIDIDFKFENFVDTYLNPANNPDIVYFGLVIMAMYSIIINL